MTGVVFGRDVNRTNANFVWLKWYNHSLSQKCGSWSWA